MFLYCLDKLSGANGKYTSIYIISLNSESNESFVCGFF